MREFTISSIIGCCVEEWDCIPGWNCHILTAILDPHSLVRNIPCTIKQRKADWNDHILRRNSHLKHVIERKVEGKGR
jgi:hypothetical protein